jgi:uncharacterized membrane protein
VAPHGLLPLTERLERASGLDPVVEALSSAAQPLARGEIRGLLAGQWLGHALHPSLTDIPLGCWTSASLLDVLGGRGARPASQRLVGLGMIAVLPTAAAGLSDWAHVDRGSQRVGVVHAVANGAAFAFYGASYLSRRRDRHWRGVLFGMAGVLASGIGGFLGGHLTLTAAVTRDNALMPEKRDATLAPVGSQPSAT